MSSTNKIEVFGVELLDVPSWVEYLTLDDDGTINGFEGYPLLKKPYGFWKENAGLRECEFFKQSDLRYEQYADEEKMIVRLGEDNTINPANEVFGSPVIA